jgi:hypothetical protein
VTSCLVCISLGNPGSFEFLLFSRSFFFRYNVQFFPLTWMTGVQFPAGEMVDFFSPHHRIQTGSGAHPASYSVGTGCSSAGVKRLGREADNSPSSSAEVKNAWS